MRRRRRWTPVKPLTPPYLLLCRYQKLWKSYVKLRHLLANSPKVKQIDKQKLTQREVSWRKTKKEEQSTLSFGKLVSCRYER